MKFNAYFEDDVQSFDATDWPDALEQAMAHEGGPDGALLRVEWDQAEATATIVEWEQTGRDPMDGERPFSPDELGTHVARSYGSVHII